MIVPDVNLLVHTLNRDSPQCARAGEWWRELLNGDEPVGLPWITVVGVVRISTNPRIFPSPIALVEVLENVDEWFAQPVVSSIEPGTEHWSIMRRLLAEAGRGGNLTTDAHLAALCIERGATLHSADGDFMRFRGLRYENPLR
ncbi:type II toxin-antitoxin system VapC family toxin [Gemmatimonas sp.]|uniref:type II toxin-antitoxin system VapC family toxin n=1 Tax=Gemmatimonas sp. TaxID=1962908 RepID=UPI00356308E3